MPVASYISVYLLFLLQFIYFPIGVSYFETPKVYLAQIGIFILLLIAIFRPQQFRFISYPKPYLFTFIAIIVLSFVHILFMLTETTFFGNEFRLQGVFLLWMLLAWAILSSRIQFERLLHPLFLFGCLFAQLLFALLIDGEGANRAIGTVGEPNALAATVLFIWPFLYFSKKDVPLWMKYAALAMVFFTIFVSGSRSGMIAFMLQLIFLLLARTNLSLIKSVIISFVLLLITYGLPFLPQSNLYEQRSEIWQAAIIAGGVSPIVGNGFGNTEGVLQDVVNNLNTNLRGSYIDSSHNIFLDWWVQGGTIGFIIFSFLIGRTFFSFIKRKHIQNLTLFLGLIAALSFNPASIISLIALWWLIGQGIAMSVSKQK